MIHSKKGIIMKQILQIVLIFALAGCNSMYIKPDTLDKSGETIYVERGGWQLQHHIKDRLEQRGYNVIVGAKRATIKSTFITPQDADLTFSTSDVGQARYIVQIAETQPTFAPIGCIFNGFWWWKFNISIADNKTSKEILNWSGRGCANSTLRKLDDALDQLEME